MKNWQQKVKEGNVSMFIHLAETFGTDEELSSDLSKNIIQHLETEFSDYFSNLVDSGFAFARNLFFVE